MYCFASENRLRVGETVSNLCNANSRVIRDCIWRYRVVKWCMTVAGATVDPMFKSNNGDNCMRLQTARLLILGCLWTIELAWGGGTWEILRDDDFKRNDGTEGILQDLQFINTEDGWAVGLRGLVLQTKDGGVTWVKRKMELANGIDFWNVCFLDEHLGFITGIRGTILKTSDGGKTWRETKWDDTKGRRGSRRLTDAWLVNEDRGFIVGENNTLLESDDGGETWRGEGKGVAVGQTRTNFERICFASATHGWIVGSFGTLLHTSDGGRTWASQDADTDSNLHGVCFLDASTGWICGQEGFISRTTDGGKTWVRQRTDTYENFYDIVFVDKKLGWAVGDYGTVAHTVDGGAGWVVGNVGSSITLWSVDAVDSNHYWAVGEWGVVVGSSVE